MLTICHSVMMSFLQERDHKITWHPYTQEKSAPLNLAIIKAKGVYLYDDEGKAYMDLISSWWTCLHGHGHPALAKAIYDQAKQLDHIMFAALTHEPAVSLCEQIRELLPSALSRFFFSDNGSCAIEIAMKLAYQYWANQGMTPKKIFVSFEGGYHGDTFGAMSVGKASGYHNVFSDFFLKVETIPFPDTWEHDDAIVHKEQHALACFDRILASYQGQLAAILVEPLVQGALGMRMCRPSFIKEIVHKAKEAGILVIFDEIMTGFFRTGTWFAMDQIGIIPDFLCLSKGLSGGILPLALTITTNDVFDAFLSDKPGYAFMHGHTYTASPIACAAALASLSLLKDDPELVSKLDRIHDTHKKGLLYLEGLSVEVQKSRTMGTISACEIPRGIPDQRFLERGLLIRPLYHNLYMIPPYCVTQKELEDAYTIVGDILQREFWIRSYENT